MMKNIIFNSSMKVEFIWDEDKMQFFIPGPNK